MPITNPAAIRFVTDQIRPLCVRARADHARRQSLATQWYSGINAMFPNDSTVVEDGRAGDGVRQLTGADVNSVMNILLAMEQQYNTEIIEKPCDRPIEAN